MGDFIGVELQRDGRTEAERAEATAGTSTNSRSKGRLNSKTATGNRHSNSSPGRQMTENYRATPSSRRRLILLAVAFLIGWAAGIALFVIGVVRSIQVTDAP